MSTFSGYDIFTGGKMKAAILAIGTELLMGQTVNTNASYLSRALSELGIGVYYHNTVGDNPKRIKESLNLLMESCDLIVTTGGLGPTLDDITKEVIAETLGLQMILDQRSLDLIQERFRLFSRSMPESNIRQAYFPEGAIILDNSQGTAPACILEVKGTDKVIVVLPGPPREMKHIYHTYIESYLKSRSQIKMHSKYLSVYDLGESALEEQLIDLIVNQTNPTLATYAGDGKVLLRITSSGGDTIDHEKMVDDMVETVKSRVGTYIVSESGEEIDRVILNRLIANNLKIAFAESCTGGKLASAFIQHPGASDVVDAGFVTYSNKAKIRDLGVDKQTLVNYGAVSHQTCAEMVKGLIDKTGCDIGVSITGIAGPTGGTEEKPVGLVYIGIGIEKEVYTFENHFAGDRTTVQNRAVIKALKLLHDTLVTHDKV